MNNRPLRHQTGRGSGATERACGKGIISDDAPLIVALLSCGAAVGRVSDVVCLWRINFKLLAV
jgi:hypothetical protein